MIPKIGYWKVKVRIAETGRYFIADINTEAYSEIRKRGMVEMKDEKGIKRTETTDFVSTVFNDCSEGKDINIIPRNIIKGKPPNKAISTAYIRNMEVRENANLEKEPELISKRKQQIAVFHASIDP